MTWITGACLICEAVAVCGSCDCPRLQILILSPRAFGYTVIVNAEIIAIGSELLTPYRQDTNSLFLTKRLNELGVDVIFKTIVGDRC